MLASGDLSSVPGLERSPGEGNGYPLLYSCLGNPMDRGILVGYGPWGHKESDVTEWLTLYFLLLVQAIPSLVCECNNDRECWNNIWSIVDDQQMFVIHKAEDWSSHKVNTQSIVIVTDLLDRIIIYWEIKNLTSFFAFFYAKKLTRTFCSLASSSLFWRAENALFEDIMAASTRGTRVGKYSEKEKGEWLPLD